MSSTQGAAPNISGVSVTANFNDRKTLINQLWNTFLKDQSDPMCLRALAWENGLLPMEHQLKERTYLDSSMVWKQRRTERFVTSMQQADPCSALCKCSPRVSSLGLGALSARRAPAGGRTARPGGRAQFCHISLRRQQAPPSNFSLLMKFSLARIECFCF